MTKRHFEAFAEAINLSNGSPEEKAFAAAIVAHVGKRFNPAFDQARFETAAGCVYTRWLTGLTLKERHRS